MIKYSANKLCFASLFCLFGYFPVEAQDSSTETDVIYQYWTDFNMAYQLTERWDLYSSVGFRTISPHTWDRYLITPSVRYQVPKLMLQDLKYREELHAGIGFFFTDNVYNSNRLEIRPFQGYKLDWPNRTRIRLRHYLRLEERFDLNTSTWVNTFGLRFRYLAEATIKLQGDVLKYNKGIYLPISIEFFWNLLDAEQFNENLRIVPGIGYTFSKKWKGEFHIGYHYARTQIKGDFTNNNIVYRLRVIYRFR